MGLVGYVVLPDKSVRASACGKWEVKASPGRWAAPGTGSGADEQTSAAAAVAFSCGSDAH